MLVLIKSMKELNFGQLMSVYEEGNLENGREFYPGLSQNQQILRAEQDFYQYLRESFFQTEGAFYAVWTEKGYYVSALRLEPYQDGLLLAALETAPDKRRQGYACRLLGAVQDWLSQHGPIKVYSHVSRKNAASQRSHQSCGFTKILDHAVYADGSVLTNSDTYLFEVQ